MKSSTALHQAVEVDIDNFPESFRLKLCSIVKHDPLRKNQHIERVKAGIAVLNQLGARNIDLFVVETGEVRVARAGILAGMGSRPPDVNASPLRQKCPRDGISDAAAATHHQHVLAVEFDFRGPCVTNVWDHFSTRKAREGRPADQVAGGPATK